jgi:Ca-activated chloride channel family protein
MDDFHFLRPFWLLAALPALAVWWGLWRQQNNAVSWWQVVDQHLLEHLIVGETKHRGPRPIQLLLLMWIICTVALAGPAWRMEPSPFADDEAGLVVLLKVSSSMLAGDVQPSRLERAKHKLRDLLELRKGKSSGLIVYSGSAHLVMPLTRDDRIISTMVEDLTPELMPVDGDALAQALQLARQVLAKSGISGSVLVIADSVSTSQVQTLSTAEITLPVQFLSVQTQSAPVDNGLQSAASNLNAPVAELTVDRADVERIARRAQSSLKSVSGTNEGTRWRDAGYALLPLIALFALMWSRRGWLVR